MARAPKTNEDAVKEEVVEEEAVVKEVVKEDDDYTYEMLAGYVDENGILHKDFTIREMTGKDEEAISAPNIKKDSAKVFQTLLVRCVTRIGSFTPKSEGNSKWAELIKNLLVGDQDYIMLKIRELSMGNELEASHECPFCKGKLRTELTTDEIEIVPFKGERKFDFELIKGYKDKKGEIHKKGVMRLPNGVDKEVVSVVSKSNMSKAGTIMLSRLCTFNDGYRIEVDTMSDLVMKDRDYLSKILQENIFGLSPEIEITCTHCGESFKGNLGNTNFI